MSEISLKSITGITSITTPTGVDNQLTVHNNNTTEAVKFDNAGNVHINNQLEVAGVSTFSVVTATSFRGDGSELTGVSGFSTALSNDTASLLNQIFKTNNTYNVGAGTSVTIQSDIGSGNIAFTRLQHINVGTGATLHIGAGTTFLMNVLKVF